MKMKTKIIIISMMCLYVIRVNAEPDAGSLSVTLSCEAAAEENLNTEGWGIGNPIEGACLALGALACNSQWSACGCVVCPAHVLSMGLPVCMALNLNVCQRRCSLQRETCLMTVSMECTGNLNSLSLLAGPTPPVNGRTTYYVATDPECQP